MFSTSKKAVAVLTASLLAFAGIQAAHAEIIYGLNSLGNNIFTFDTSAPATIGSAKFISGLATNEQLISIDVRPATGILYGMGSMGRLYTITPATGVATFVGSSGNSLDGVNFGSDFNPVTDQLRMVSDTGMNNRINPTTGALASFDSPLAYAPADAHVNGATNIVGIAYSTPVANATTLYGIDSGFDTLVTITGNTGVISTVGSLGLDFSSVAGLDYSSSGTLYAALQPSSSGISNLYTVNTATGAATLVGQIGGGFIVSDIALADAGGAGIPEPTTLALLSLAVPALLVRRRRS